ncbi:GOLPH3/VPS74 family protein [Streptomyces sp. NPDC054961]
MRLTLAEEITLLSLDDESGALKRRQSAGWAVAGAVLLELVMLKRVSVSGKYLHLVDTSPTGEELLDGRIELMSAWLRGKNMRRVTDWLTKDQSRVMAAAVARLAERGVVGEERHKALGIFPVRRHPEIDGEVERALRERLASVVLEGVEPDERTAGLVALIHSAKLHALVFPDRPRKETSARMAELAEGQWAAESVRAAIRDMQIAMAAVTVVTVAAV